jgi:hypothetical protein
MLFPAAQTHHTAVMVAVVVQQELHKPQALAR